MLNSHFTVDKNVRRQMLTICKKSVFRMAIWCHHHKHYKKLRQQGTHYEVSIYSHISNSGKILKLLCRVVHSAKCRIA